MSFDPLHKIVSPSLTQQPVYTAKRRKKSESVAAVSFSANKSDSTLEERVVCVRGREHARLDLVGRLSPKPAAEVPTFFVDQYIESFKGFAPKISMTKEEFCSLNLFKYTTEKEVVFEELVSLLKDNLFIYFYKDFLVNIKKDAWFDFYLMFDPRTLAFLSLAAFLDGKIDQNDLCTVHLIASAMFEKQQGRIENFYVKDETKKTIVHTLKKAHYPPFEVFQDSEDLPIIFQKYGQINPLIISDKTEEELQCVKDEFIKNFDKKTPLQRTVLSYDFKAQLDDTVAMLEANLYCNAVSAEGFTNIEKDETRNEMKATVVIPQLSMIANLSRQLVKSHTTVAFPEGVMAMDKKTDKLIPKTHELVFGYSENQEVEDAFQSGVRVISIASPLFMLPYVHYAIKGPPGLGMTLHDLYHLYLDINNPHLDIILNLRALLCDQLSMPDFEDSNGWIKMVTDRLLDREYRFVFFMEGERLDQLSFLLAKILQAVFQVARENPDILEINLKRSIWLFEVFLPLIEVPLKGYPMWDREIFIKTLCKDDCPGVVPIDSRSIDQLKRELCDVLSQKPKGV